MGFKWRHLLVILGLILAAIWISQPAPREEALQYYRSGRVFEAQGKLVAQCARAPADRALALALVDVHLQAGQPERAAVVLRTCLEHHRGDVVMALRLAELFQQANRLDDALAALDGLPVTPELLRRRAGLHEERGNLREAAADLERLRDGGPGDVALLEHLSYVHAWRGDLPAKARVLEQLARLKRSPEAVDEWLEAVLWLHDREAVRRACVVAESLRDATTELLHTVFTTYVNERDLAGARRIGVRVTSQADAQATDWINRAQVETWDAKPLAAVAILAEAAARFPRHPEVLENLTASCFSNGRRADALEYAVRLAEVTARAGHRRQAAQIANDLGHRVQARALLAPLIAHQPPDVEALLLDAHIALQVGEPSAARHHLAILASEATRRPAEPYLARRGAELAAALDDQVLRRQLLETLLQYQPRFFAGLMDLAQAYSEVGRCDEALELLGRAAVLPGADPIALAHLRARTCLAAVWRTVAGDPTLSARRVRAVTTVVSALAAKEDAELRLELIRLHLERNDALAAHQAMAGLVDIPADVRVTLIQLLVEHGALVEARRQLAQVPALNTLGHTTLAGVALAYLRLGDAALAVAAFERALAGAPDSDFYRTGLADACCAAGDAPRGLGLLRARAERAPPERAEEFWLDLADRHRWREDASGESAALALALRTLGSRPGLLCRLVEVAERRGLHGEALDHWRRLEALFPAAGASAPPSLLRAAAAACYAQGDPATATRLYERLLAMQPDDAVTLLMLARLAAQDGRVTDAERLFRRSLARNPSEVWAWYDLGEMLAAHGRDGRRELEEALRRLPASDKPAELAAAANCHHRLGRNDEALRLYQRALARGGDSNVAADCAVLLMELNRLQQAGMIVATARARLTENRRLTRIAASIHLALDEPHQALAILRELGAERSDDRSLLADLALAAEGTGAWTEAMRYYTLAGSAR